MVAAMREMLVTAGVDKRMTSERKNLPDTEMNDQSLPAVIGG